MKFQVESPDGRSLMLEGDHEPNESELQEIFQSFPAAKEQPTATDIQDAEPVMPLADMFARQDRSDILKPRPAPIAREPIVTTIQGGPQKRVPGDESFGREMGEAINTPIVKASELLKIDPQTIANAADVIRAAATSYDLSINEKGELNPVKTFTEIAGTPNRVPNTAEKALSGIQSGVAESLDFFTTPLGIATLGTTSLPTVAQKAIATAFIAQMSSTYPEQLKALNEAWKAGDTEGISKNLTSLGLTTAFVGTAAHGVASDPLVKNLEQNNAPLTAKAVEETKAVPLEDVPHTVTDKINESLAQAPVEDAAERLDQLIPDSKNKWSGEDLGKYPVIAFELKNGDVYAYPHAKIHPQAVDYGFVVDPNLVKSKGFVINGKYVEGSQESGEFSTGREVPPEPTVALSDFERYQELTGQIKRVSKGLSNMSVTRRMEVLGEIEAIKNKYGGKPPPENPSVTKPSESVSPPQAEPANVREQQPAVVTETYKIIDFEKRAGMDTGDFNKVLEAARLMEKDEPIDATGLIIKKASTGSVYLGKIVTAPDGVREFQNVWRASDHPQVQGGYLNETRVGDVIKSTLPEIGKRIREHIEKITSKKPNEKAQEVTQAEVLTQSKFRVGNSPQLWTEVERPKATPEEIANKEQPVRVKNDKTGEIQTVLESDLTPVKERVGDKPKATSVADLDAQIEKAGLDPANFPTKANKRDIIARIKAQGIKGMGAATLGELEASPHTPTSIKNRQVDIERAERGLPPMIQPIKRGFGTVWDEAMAKIDQDPAYPDRLINELREKPRSITDLEDATLLHRRVELRNEYGKATRDLAEAHDDGRLEDVSREEIRVQGLSDALLDLEKITKGAGTSTARGLNARKMMAFEDYTLAQMELESRLAKGGRQLTPEERTEITKLHERIADTQKRFDEYVSGAEERIRQLELENALKDVKKQSKRDAKVKEKPDLEERKTKVKAQIKERIDEGQAEDISSLVQRLARLFVEQGVTDRDVLINSVHGALKDIDPEFTRRETMDAISGYGKFKQLSKDEISLQLRDLKGQMQQVAKLEDMQAGQPPLKTGIERRIPSTEESRLIRLVNEAKQEFQIPISDEATQLKSSLDMLKARLKHKTAELQDRLARGDFSKKPKRILKMDAEANRLHFENTKAKIAYHEGLIKDRMANRGTLQKIGGTILEVMNTTRAIKTSIDVSAVLRQGGFMAFGHPIRAAKSLGPMFRAFGSEKAQHAINEEIISRKNYPLMLRSKLYLSEHGHSLSKMEEAYMSRWADKIPLVAGSQRAYVTFLNKFRADSFDAMADTLGRNKELTQAEADAIANYINVATGRGSLGVRDNAMVGLSSVFFAPRYVASRFQLLAGQPLYRGSARTRSMIAKEYARFLIGVGVVYALGGLAGATVETDPRSTDFGKMKWGNTRLDPLAGLQQETVLLSRLGSGQTKNAKGKVLPIRGDKVPFGGQTSSDLMKTFIRGKLAPWPATAVNVLEGKDVVGQSVTPATVASGLLTPLAPMDIYQALKEQGIERGTALGLLSLFGMGLQTYDNKKRKPTVEQPERDPALDATMR